MTFQGRVLGSVDLIGAPLRKPSGIDVAMAQNSHAQRKTQIWWSRCLPWKQASAYLPFQDFEAICKNGGENRFATSMLGENSLIVRGLVWNWKGIQGYPQKSQALIHRIISGFQPKGSNLYHTTNGLISLSLSQFTSWNKWYLKHPFVLRRITYFHWISMMFYCIYIFILHISSLNNLIKWRCTNIITNVVVSTHLKKL